MHAVENSISYRDPCFSINRVHRRFVLTTYATNAINHIHKCGGGSSDHERPPSFGLLSAYRVHSSVPTSKQHLHTERVSYKHSQLRFECVFHCAASVRQHPLGICPDATMAVLCAGCSIGVGDLQLRAGVIPSMLFDPVPSEEILQIEAMAGGVSSRASAYCQYLMHSRLRHFEAGRNRRRVLIFRYYFFALAQPATWRWVQYYSFMMIVIRSEERRVGKEC